MLAVIGGGGVVTGSNPSYTSLELNHQVRVSQARFLIAEPQVLGTTLESVKACGIPHTNVFAFETRDQAPVPRRKSWMSLLEHGEADWFTFDSLEEAKSTIATLPSPLPVE
ncbi:MAG: hypothetical protein Q9173_000472 [Seirophora scorigena]